MTDDAKVVGLKSIKNSEQKRFQKPFQKESPHYAPNLGRFLSLCEQNYLLAQQLCQAAGQLIEKGGQVQFGLMLKGEELGLVQCSLIEKSRYTSSIVFHQIHPSSDWLPGTQFKVRLYHDAELAEVVEFQGCRHVEATYCYPNSSMHQCDEKQQHNQFLNEWLLFCMAYGCNAQAVAMRRH